MKILSRHIVYFLITSSTLFGIDKIDNLLWNPKITGHLSEEYEGVLRTLDGGYIEVFWANVKESWWTTNHIQISRFDSSYNTIWVKTLGNSSSYLEQLGPVYKHNSGIDYGSYSQHLNEYANIIITDSQSSLRELNVSPNLEITSYNTQDKGYVILGSIEQDKHRSQYTIYNLPKNDTSAILLIKIDHEGNELWRKIYYKDSEYQGYEYSEAIDIKQTYDGGYIIIGKHEKTDYREKDIYLWLIKVDYMGNIIWEKSIDYHPIHSMDVALDGSIVLSGSTYDHEQKDPQKRYFMFLLKFDNNGNMLWKKNVGQGYGYTYYPTQVSHTNDGGYIFISNEKIDQKFIYGTYHGNVSYINVVKLDKHGELMWLKKVGKLNDLNSFTSIKQNGEGNYIIKGTTFSTLWGGWMMMLDQEGNIIKLN